MSFVRRAHYGLSSVGLGPTREGVLTGNIPQRFLHALLISSVHTSDCVSVWPGSSWGPGWMEERSRLEDLEIEEWRNRGGGGVG